ncbi:MAG: GNAT family N-acetyltransferase [Deltaproteobacteria bacterium]|nr:GNAT family N-acetyltransferase [Deltaproteobacteria bacterium]
MIQSPDPARISPHRGLTFSGEVLPHHPGQVCQLAEATGFFNREEVSIAEELVGERLAGGEASGYLFLFAHHNQNLAGYTCWGAIPGTQSSYDLYWIVVHPDWQGKGLGRELMARTEALIQQAGGGKIYIETSSRDQYIPTQGFYGRMGYTREALLPDFYAPGDGKLIYAKKV